MKRSIYLLFLFSIPFLSACNSPKSLYKKGIKMEAAQLNEEASTYYYNALIKKPEFIEAREALYRSGGQVLNDKISIFFNESQIGNKKEAINAFLAARKYKEMLAKVKVDLSIPTQYTKDFNEIKKSYLLELYEDGLTFLDQEDYTSAEDVFKEIARLEPNYKDTKKLKDIAYIEPIYKKGKVALEEYKYRTSFNAFLEVLNIDNDYKDSRELQAMALEEGMVSVGLISFENATSIANTEKKAEAYTLDALSTTEDPFLKVIDRTNYQQLLEEQRINLSGAVDESTAAEAGNLLGVKWLLGGTLLDLSKYKSKLSKKRREGFKSYNVKMTNSEGEEYYETRYKLVYFYEYWQESSVNISIQMKLISLTTGEIEKAKILNKELGDKIHYYIYEGDAKKLYPALDGKVVTSYSARNNMQSLIKGRRKLKSISTLNNEAFLTIASQVKSEIEKFSYNYVK
jgi:hypothetical protein